MGEQTLVEPYQVTVEHRSQWDWEDPEWLTLFIAQVWSRTHRFPSTQQELYAINYEEIRQGFRRFKAGEFTVQARGTTLEEGWIAITVLSRQFYMCLRNVQEYWPGDRIPEPFKVDLLPTEIWDYVYHSFEYHQEQVAELPFAELSRVPDPTGTLGLFLGNCAHSITVVGILFDEERILFYDSWQKGNRQSLLSKGQNAAGLKAIRIAEHSWSITREEFTKRVLFFCTPKASYDYYSRRIRDQINIGN
jgi:hypothetical protein